MTSSDAPGTLSVVTVQADARVTIPIIILIYGVGGLVIKNRCNLPFYSFFRVQYEPTPTSATSLMNGTMTYGCRNCGLYSFFPPKNEIQNKAKQETEQF